MAATTNTGDMQLDPKYDDYDFPVVAPVKQDGHPGHLTTEQQEKVKQLRESLEKKGYTDRLDTLTLASWTEVMCSSCEPAVLTWTVAAAIPACAQVRPGRYRDDVRPPIVACRLEEHIKGYQRMRC